ncbi:hypothetical protein BG003_004667 [Podila horticola]|nr:hypothetical protein BG003_004667 [Podila horticola]
MSQPKDTEPLSFQAFKSKDGKPLQRLPTQIRCPDTRNFCISWQDIEDAFEGVDYVDFLGWGDDDPVRSPFVVGRNGEVLLPLRIWCFNGALRVIYREDQGLLSPALEIQYLYRTLIDVLKILYEKRTSDRETFMEWAANVRYHHSKMMNQLTVLKEIGVKIEFEGKTEDQILEESQQPLSWLEFCDYQNLCIHVLDCYMNYPVPCRFVVLPADLGSWDDLDPTTHTFRLYFLCDVNKDSSEDWLNMLTPDENKDESNLPKLPEHKHFSNHPGYNLIRSQEFFQTYGGYVLMILRMIVYGFSYNRYEIPQLETSKILWGYDTDGGSSHLSSVKIGPLISKAISYLEGLSLPKRGAEMWLTEREAVEIEDFLDTPEDCNALGELYRFTYNHYWYWTCEQHAYRRFASGTMEALEDFVHSCGGHVDTQLATLQLELHSRSQVDMLSTLLHNIKYTFHVITLDWNDASQQVLEDSLQKAVAAKVRNSDSEYFLGSAAIEKARHLRLSGVWCDVHPQDNLGYKADIFANLIYKNRDLQSVTVLSYPRPQEQCTYFSQPNSPVYWIHSKQQQHEEPKYWWKDLWEKAHDFTEAIMCNNKNGLAKASRRLQDILTEHGYLSVSTISTLRKYWCAEFDMQEGTIRELQIYDILGLSEDIIGDGVKIRLLGILKSLRVLTVDVDDLDTDEVVTRMVKASPQLQELNISIKDGRALELVEKAVKMWHSRCDRLRLTLLERNSDGQGRVIAQAVIRGHAYSSAGSNSTDIQGYNARPVNTQEWKLDIAAKADFLQWNSDHVSTPLADLTAALLNKATVQYPSVLTFINLDISHLFLDGLPYLQNIFRRSILRCLHVCCTAFDPSLIDYVCQMLISVQWCTLQSMVLFGGAVNEWIEILATVCDENTVASACLPDLQLQYFRVQGSDKRSVCLSHSSVLFVHQLVYLNPSMELVLENVFLQDGRDSDLLPECIGSQGKSKDC